ncbi:MAG TPA: hypothetical protein VLE89_08800 [Chlamydiales bacterium]|nr:hypothetical protein [Chlamydiales bacterium]
MNTRKWTQIEPLYHFNALEKVGNALLKPAEKVFTKWDSTNNVLVRVALVVAAVFATVLGVIGAILKEAGELCNPNRGVRVKLLQNVLEFRKILAERTNVKIHSDADAEFAVADLLLQGLSNGMKGWTVDTLFRDKILKEKHHASEGTLKALGHYGLLAILGGSNQDANFDEIKDLTKKWEKSWTELRRKGVEGQDIASEKTAIIEMTEQNFELHRAVHVLFAEMDKDVQLNAAALKLARNYSQLSAQIA